MTPESECWPEFLKSLSYMWNMTKCGRKKAAQSHSNSSTKNKNTSEKNKSKIKLEILQPCNMQENNKCYMFFM